MFNIRNGSWETNSSSVHVLVIPKDTNVTIPKKVFLSGVNMDGKLDALIH